jgi:type I restriction enzyme S subunit
MRKYDSYKDSGVEWIGEIPSHWKTIKTYLITENLDGKRIPLNSEQRGDMGGDIPYWGSGGIVDHINEFIFDEELLLVGEDGSPFFDPFRDVSFYVNEKIWVNNHIHILRTKEKVNTKFLVESFNCVDYKEYITGSTRDKLTQSDLNRIIHPIPPLSEQQQIVSYLDTKTSQIDSLIEKTKLKIQLLKENRTSLINEVVTKGLNPNVEMKDSGVEWIGEIPSHWETTKLKFQGEVIIGLSYSPENVVDEGDETTLVMRSSNVQNGKPSFHDNVFVNSNIPKKLRTKENDILICSRNGSRNLIGKNCLIPKENENLTWGVFMTVYRSKSPKFIYWLLNSPVFESQSGLFLTSTINQLTVSTLENMVVPFVSDVNEQNEIVSYLDEHTQLIDKTISVEQRRIDTLKEYRQSLISEVVTGKRKVVN